MDRRVWDSRGCGGGGEEGKGVGVGVGVGGRSERGLAVDAMTGSAGSPRQP